MKTFYFVNEVQCEVFTHFTLANSGSLFLTYFVDIYFTDSLAGEKGSFDCPFCRKECKTSSDGFPACLLSEFLKDKLDFPTHAASPCGKKDLKKQSKGLLQWHWQSPSQHSMSWLSLARVIKSSPRWDEYSFNELLISSWNLLSCCMVVC